MATHAEPRPGKRGGSRRPPLLVCHSGGRKTPFLRGMLTHDLVQRGLSFDDAYAAAHAVRDRLAERAEISTAELEEVLNQQLEEMLGIEAAHKLPAPVRREPELTVTFRGDNPQPFSRGLLATSMYAAGVDLDRAYRLVSRLQQQLRREGVQSLDSDELSRLVGDLLERHQDADVASRYRVLRAIRQLPRPLVLYLAGATGAGKSTLALQLAPLLRIYRVNSTDTIRQVMRMIFSPAILPSLHRSSFEVASPEEAGLLGELAGGLPQDDLRRRVIASFDEQATRVLVGVRAVVERSVAENVSVLVEGVHLMPPLVPFQSLEGAAHQIMLVLTTLDEEVHRSRFLARGPLGSRRAERYLENFTAIRLIQEHLLQHAEAHDVPLIDTTELESVLERTLRVITGVLQRQVPRLAEGAHSVEAPPLLLLILDGMPDLPVRALGGRTPMAAAHTPTLDRLAREGRCGLADPVAPGVVPDTAAGSLALFGQSPLALKRGPVEALGAGLQLASGDIALRCNLATLDERGWVVDRRAGRIREEAALLVAALDQLTLPGDAATGVTIRVGAGTEHRLALVLRGEGLSSGIYGSDPGDGAPPGPPLVPRPVDPKDERAVRTAQILALFEQEARRVLAEHAVNRGRQERGLPPANAILTRGAGRIHPLEPLRRQGQPLRAACISGDQTLLGLAAWLGHETVSGEGLTANLDTDLPAKFTAALELLPSRDLVVLHLKGADIAGHDRRPDLKVAFLEQVDRQLAWLLENYPGPLRIAVASDHATLSETGQHSADPVPILTWGPDVEPDTVETFDERAVAAGGLQRFPLQLLLPRLLG